MIERCKKVHELQVQDCALVPRDNRHNSFSTFVRASSLCGSASHTPATLSRLALRKCHIQRARQKLKSVARKSSCASTQKMVGPMSDSDRSVSPPIIFTAAFSVCSHEVSFPSSDTVAFGLFSSSDCCRCYCVHRGLCARHFHCVPALHVRE